MTPTLRPLVILLTVLVVTMVACGDSDDRAQQANSGGVSLHTELGGNAEGYERACACLLYTSPSPRDRG